MGRDRLAEFREKAAAAADNTTDTELTAEDNHVNNNDICIPMEALGPSEAVLQRFFNEV